LLERLLRRLLWVLPSALAITLLLFFALSRVPPERMTPSSPHVRYRELPVFFNLRPSDVRTAVRRAMLDLVAAPESSDDEREAGRRLVRIGGAGLPTLMAELDSYAPADRVRLLLSLEPLARRMGLPNAKEAARPESVLRFWSRFWEASEVEFRLPAARTATRRWIVYGDRAREEEVFRLDTFALEPLFELLPSRVETRDLREIARNVDVIAHVTEREDRLSPEATVDEAVSCLARWRRLWLERRSSHAMLTGTDRIMAFALESRFGKWAQEWIGERLPGEAGAAPVLRRAAASMSLVGVAWLAATLLGVGLGVLSGLARTPVTRHGAAWLGVALLSATPVGLGAVVRRVLVGPGFEWLGAAAVLTLGMIAKPLLSTRSRATTRLDGDRLVAALARGATRQHVAWTEGLRAAVAPVAAESLLELPFALSASFVVERMFGLDGLGATTLEAVASADVGGVIGPAVLATFVGGVALLASDVVLAVAIPHVRPLLHRLGSRA